MKDWLTAAEIAQLALPDLPATKRGVALKAATEGWDCHPAFARARKGRGGGYEYNIRLLPTLAQVAYCQRTMTVGAANDSVSEESAAPAERKLTARGLEERDARLAVVTAYEALARGLRLGQAACLQVFCDKYNGGTLAVDPWVRNLVPRVAKRTMLGWLAAKRSGSIDTLAVDRSLARKGTGTLSRANDGDVQRWMLALIAHQPHLSAFEVRRQVRSEFGDTLTVGGKSIAVPPVRQFQRFLKDMKADHQVLLTKITNPDLYRSTMRPAGTGTLRFITQPNSLWMIDASPVDALCVDGRYSIYACIDVATRRLVLLVTKTPRASAVALLMRKAIMAWGAPDAVKTDNGSDFVARDTKRLMASLGIAVEVSDAYSPEQKGHIERAIKTFQHQVAPLLPGYVGHSVADRKAIESRKSFAVRLGEDDTQTFGVSLSASDLQAHIDRWAELSYQHAPHGGLKGRTPFEVAAAANHVVRTVDERALDLLLMPVADGGGMRTVTKLGIRVGGFQYASGHLLPKQSVFVRHDPANMGKVYVFAADGAEFICEAFCPELAGIDPATFHRARREMVAERLNDAARQVRADMREIGKKPLIERALEVAARDVPNVVRLPHKTTEQVTPQIAAAKAAITRPVPKADDAVLAERDRLISNADRVEADFERQIERHESQVEAERVARFGTGNVVAMPTSPKDNYLRALALQDRIRAGEAVDAEDAYWLGKYQTHPEFLGQQRVHEAFGDAYLQA